ncbi:MAG: hypothetical protein ACE5F1_06405 [Planctomycetota bacterium]
MSSSSRAITEASFAYLAARTLADDAFLEKLKRDARAFGIPAIWISPEQASLMQILL